MWQVAQGCPVWRANDGRALAGDGASQPIANTSSAETARPKAGQLRCPEELSSQTLLLTSNVPRRFRSDKQIAASAYFSEDAPSTKLKYDASAAI